MKAIIGASVGAFITAFAAVAPCAAQDSPFAGGKPLTIVIGFGPGGGYDLWGRAVARHIGKHLPGGPLGIAQNMPGAGSYNAANHVYNVAPKDGTVMGVIARDAPMGPLYGQMGPRFDPLRMSWIGTPAKETNVCIAYHTAKVSNIADLYAHELIVGDVGSGTGTHTYPRALSVILGLRFKLIAGFSSSAEVFLAMERGEVDGICESLDSVHGKKPDWIPNQRVSLIFQGGAKPNPQIKDVPFVLDLAKTDQQRAMIQFLYAGQAIGRPFIAPPNLQPGRLNMLRAGFNATMKDPEFVAEARRLNLELDPETGEELEATIRQIYETPKDIVERVSALVK